LKNSKLQKMAIHNKQLLIMIDLIDWLVLPATRWYIQQLVKVQEKAAQFKVCFYLHPFIEHIQLASTHNEYMP
jgi:hypothetical protein